MKKDFSDKVKHITLNIRNIREEKNYSQEYMAMRMRISQNAYSKIELSNSKLTVSRLIEIATILDINICNLLDPDTPPVEYQTVDNPK
ncbi:helix-turn-helix transcriptional regulator [Mucilaginibacter pallidiroseus]|uniref:Helix-turn-helix transcriptional regulator n=1 Tax=Mucilaginibacter pallidiroseus TaxID=2599295 RepID=A0A563UIH8_9SPHI|nr:helix-turn-helix transcriptional regulator [Mucilaginibacter pallidiroseus]TWR31099.1 helix-turn-helix transcriptional regulator [Mucilaginibacter pallidiroseus]